MKCNKIPTRVGYIPLQLINIHMEVVANIMPVMLPMFFSILLTVFGLTGIGTFLTPKPTTVEMIIYFIVGVVLYLYIAIKTYKLLMSMDKYSRFMEKLKHSRK